MLAYLKNAANRAYTENGAVSYASSMSDVLDLFATIGALRGAPEQEIVDRFVRAYAEDPDLAMKILFYARDIRGGLGERRVFRIILEYLADHEPASVRKNLESISEFGRWDDVLVLLGSSVEAEALALIRRQLMEDMKALEAEQSISLLAKWLPSVNASNDDTVAAARKVARSLGMSDEKYRKVLSRLRKALRILENNLRQQDYSFSYAAQPSRALFKYRKAFHRNDGERYSAYLDQVAGGQAVMHTDALYPYDIIAPAVSGQILSDRERRAMDVTWNAQKDFAGNGNALVVMDGSGSMYWSGQQPVPAAVAQSLAIYFAERNSGAFHNHFITFSENPRLVEIKGSDIVEKVRYARSFNEVANTNLRRVFELILSVALKNRLPQEELPESLYIISDMEFDSAVRGGDMANFDWAKQEYQRYGYKLPRVVFWNVASRNRQQPVTMNEQGAVLVSGASPRIFSMVMDGIQSPMEEMLHILGAERYACIAA